MFFKISLVWLAFFSLCLKAENLLRFSQGSAELSPVFAEQQPEILKLIDFGYAAVNHFNYPRCYHKTPQKHFDEVYVAMLSSLDEKWDFYWIRGEIGHDSISKSHLHKKLFKKVKQRPEVSGLIAVSKKRPVIVVVFNGSYSLESWKSNLNIHAAIGVDIGLNSPLHEGFYLRHLSLRESFHSGLDSAIARVRKQWPSEVIYTIFTGHSQGAASAQLAIYDLSHQSAAEKAQGKMNAFGWFISPPCLCLNTECREIFLKKVGKENVVHHDIGLDLSLKSYAAFKIELSQTLKDFRSPSKFLLGIKESTKALLYQRQYILGYRAKQPLSLTKKMIPRQKGIWRRMMGTLATVHFGRSNGYGDYFFSSDLVKTDFRKFLRHIPIFDGQGI